MRVKKPKRPTTPPSEDEVDDNFVVDPDQIFDELPQPFRLVDKTLRQIFDAAWERIEGIEERKALKRSKAVLPLFELAKQLSEYNGTTCICSVADGKYLFICYSNGLAVVDSFLGTVVACYEEPGNSILQISACCLQEGYYLISTLDTEGTLLTCPCIEFNKLALLSVHPLSPPVIYFECYQYLTKNANATVNKRNIALHTNII